MKLAIIGGGSTYTPELLSGMLGDAQASRPPITDVSLYDIDSNRARVIAEFCTRMTVASAGDLSISVSATLAEALGGADFVVSQFRVGGQEARHTDISIGLEHNLIGQETVGVGGFLKAMRTIPVALKLASDIERYCPQAWLLNFTNPSGIVTAAIQRHSHVKVIGLCNVPIEMRMDIAAVLQRDAGDVNLDWIGLNHLGWVRRVMVDGTDVLPGLLEKIEDNISGPANLPELSYPDGFLQTLGMLPCSYLRYYYAPRAMFRAIASREQTRAEEVMEIDRRLFEYYTDANNHTPPALLTQRGGAWYSRLAVRVMAALSAPAGESIVEIVGTAAGENIGPFLADDVVEAPCEIGGHGIKRLALSPPEPSIAGLCAQMLAYERAVVCAAQSGRRQDALLALQLNPLVGDVMLADRILAGRLS